MNVAWARKPKVKHARLTDSLILIRAMAFDMMQDGDLCDYSVDCEHELCQRIHHIITDCNNAYNEITEQRGRESGSIG